MAHASYNCCAICDCKLEFNEWDAKTKEEICVGCIEASIRLGHPITRSEQIKEYLSQLPDKEALLWLHAMHFDPCYYANPTDAYLTERGLVLTDQPEGKLGNQLKPLA